MPHAVASDGVKLYYEEAGRGQAVIFVHEFAGDHRSWEPQMRQFSRYFRVITFSARGYPPSDIPPTPAGYSQERARDDILAVLDHLDIAQAHVVGLSMGAFATLHVGLGAPHRARSLVVAGCGYGAEPGQRESFRKECEGVAARFDREGMAACAASYTRGPARLQHEAKDPRGYAEFAGRMAEHSALGSANTLRGVQMERPGLWELMGAMESMRVPTLIVTGDEDEPCLEPSLLMKRTIPGAGLVVLPRSGHNINIEEPDAFNRSLMEFFLAVEAGRWEITPNVPSDGGILGAKRG